MQLAIDSPEPASGSKIYPALPKASEAEELSCLPSKSEPSRQRQTTRRSTTLCSALGGAIPSFPVFVPAERLRKPSQRSV